MCLMCLHVTFTSKHHKLDQKLSTTNGNCNWIVKDQMLKLCYASVTFWLQSNDKSKIARTHQPLRLWQTQKGVAFCVNDSVLLIYPGNKTSNFPSVVGSIRTQKKKIAVPLEGESTVMNELHEIEMFRNHKVIHVLQSCNVKLRLLWVVA